MLRTQAKLILIGLIILLPAFSGLAACRDAGGQVAEPVAPSPPAVASATAAPAQAPAAGLQGVDWHLISYADRKGNQAGLLPGSEITITFNDGQVSGSAGCNSYFAVYRLESETLALRDAAVTEMFCMAPEGLMEQENAYLAALQTTASFRIADDRLHLLDGQGRTILTFRRP